MNFAALAPAMQIGASVGLLLARRPPAVTSACWRGGPRMPSHCAKGHPLRFVARVGAVTRRGARVLRRAYACDACRAYVLRAESARELPLAYAPPAGAP